MNQGTAVLDAPAPSDAINVEIQEVLGNTPILGDPLPPTVTDDPTGEDDDPDWGDTGEDEDPDDDDDEDPDDDRD